MNGTGLRAVTIAGLGAYLPKIILTNDDLELLVDTNDEWIPARTGIKSGESPMEVQSH